MKKLTPLALTLFVLGWSTLSLPQEKKVEESKQDKADPEKRIEKLLCKKELKPKDRGGLKGWTHSSFIGKCQSCKGDVSNPIEGQDCMDKHSQLDVLYCLDCAEKENVCFICGAKRKDAKKKENEKLLCEKHKSPGCQYQGNCKKCGVKVENLLDSLCDHVHIQAPPWTCCLDCAKKESICPVCGAKVEKAKKKETSIRYHCEKCKKDLSKDDIKLEGHTPNSLHAHPMPCQYYVHKECRGVVQEIVESEKEEGADKKSGDSRYIQPGNCNGGHIGTADFVTGGCPRDKGDLSSGSMKICNKCAKELGVCAYCLKKVE